MLLTLPYVRRFFFFPITHCKRNHLSLVGCLYGLEFWLSSNQIDFFSIQPQIIWSVSNQCSTRENKTETVAWNNKNEYKWKLSWMQYTFIRIYCSTFLYVVSTLWWSFFTICVKPTFSEHCLLRKLVQLVIRLHGFCPELAEESILEMMNQRLVLQCPEDFG